MAASAGDAHPWPIYNARFRVTFPILDADGDLVTGAASLDSEASQDQGTFADCTNEATEIATSSGMYYLDLVATELDTKQTAVIVKTATAGAKTTPMVLYPVRLPVLRTGTAQAGGGSTITLDSGASAKDEYYTGCYVNPTNNTPSNVQGQARRIIGYVGSTKVATVEVAWGTNPSSSTTFEILLPGDTINAVQWAGTAVADPATSGVPEVNVKAISGDTGAADNAESFFDGTGYAGTNNVIPLVTTVTNLTNAPTAGDLTATMKASVQAELLAFLKLDWTGITGEAARSMLNALRFLRNKWTLTGTTLSVKKEDDTTEAWASTVTVDAAADPITGSDPT